MNYSILKYEKDNISLDVRYDDENKTFWLTQSEIATLFNISKDNVKQIIKRLKEAQKNTSGGDNLSPTEMQIDVAGADGKIYKTKAYNLDMIEAISHRSKSTSGYDFVKWTRDYINNNSQQSITQFSSDEAIKSKIYTIRGEKVMLDFELAEFYGYETFRFNEQVKNNIDRFPKRYRFQLTQEEFNLILISKKSMSSWGGRRTLPYAFTKQGIYMLMTVLNGELAIQQSIMLIDTFKAMKDYIVRSNNLLSLNELLRFTSTVNDHSNYIMDLREENTKIKDNISKVQDKQADNDLKLEKVMEYFNNPSTHKEFTFYNNQRVEAYIAYQEIYAEAKQSIIYIDDYISAKTLQLLKACNPGINITFITDNLASTLTLSIVTAFETDTKIKPNVIQNLNAVHDRYIIIDFGTLNEKIYHCGHSAKDVGGRVSSIIEAKTELLTDDYINNLLQHPNLVLK